MIREFITTPTFDKMWHALGLGDQDQRDLEKMLLANPKAGAVIPGSGGVRKLRITLPGTGKRGGARVIYIDIMVHERIYFLMAYPKGKKETTTADENKVLMALANECKKEVDGNTNG